MYARPRACCCTRIFTIRFWMNWWRHAKNCGLATRWTPPPKMVSQISGANGPRSRYIEPEEEGARLLGGERDRGRQGQGFLRQADDLRRRDSADADRPRRDLRAGARDIRFRDAEEALRIANATIYGLAAAVWTRDMQACTRMAPASAGIVWINTYNLRFRLALRRV